MPTEIEKMKWEDHSLDELNRVRNSEPCHSPNHMAATGELMRRQMGELITIADTQKILAEKLETQTRRLIRFTIGLYVFTVVVAFLGAVQIVLMILDYFSNNH